MKCPVCNTPDLVMSERKGIEIDYCPECRGVWLDRGELDKILERTIQEEAATPARHAPPPQRPASGHDPHYDRRHERHYRKKKHWLSEIFD